MAESSVLEEMVDIFSTFYLSLRQIQLTKLIIL